MRVTPPVTLTWLKLPAPVPLSATEKLGVPVLRLSALLVSVPAGLPGASVPPDAVDVMVPVVPVPLSVPPFRLTALDPC